MQTEGIGKHLLPGLVAGALAFGTPHKVEAGMAYAGGGGAVAANAARVDRDMHIDDKLVNFIKSVENSKTYKPGGWRAGKWHQYLDKGVPAIGYGHRLGHGESYPNGITDEEAVNLIRKDMAKAKKAMYNELHTRYKYADDDLDPDAEMMLTDFEYNMGTISTFPKFVNALIVKNWKVAANEYKRHSDGKELGRNVPFYNTFLKDKVTSAK